MLNINEMWMTLILQTLSTNNLTEWLPGQAEWAGRHLNVALPLWQSLSNDLIDRQEAIGSFASFTTSPDPTIREWAWNLRNSYNELRHSADETIRKYYFHCIGKAARAGGAKAEQKKIESIGKCLSNPILKYVRAGKRSELLVSHSNWVFRISRKLDLGIIVNSQVEFQVFLSPTPSNTQMFTKDALPTDPASRLAVSIKGVGTKGPFHLFLHNPGLSTVKQMNSFVDALEGCKREETMRFGRRWWRERRNGKNVTFYS